MTQHLGLPGGNWKQKPNVESGYERELDKKKYTILLILNF